MRILLTGHKGYLGRNIYEALTKENAHEVHGLDCNSDYCQFTDMFLQFKRRGEYFDLIIHNGAISNSLKTGNRLWQLNYQASTEIADYCYHVNTKLIFISSAAAIEPDTPYGWSKHCAEYYIRQSIADKTLCILRPFNIWSFDEEGKQELSIISKILTGQLEQVYWKCTRDFIHVSDVVSAVCQVANDWKYGIYDIGTAEPTDISSLANHLYDGVETDTKPPIVSECPIKEKVVARQAELLPNWSATSLTEHLVALKSHLIERIRK
jgi:nucleoside-diphosphate-sugar epimerase